MKIPWKTSEPAIRYMVAARKHAGAGGACSSALLQNPPASASGIPAPTIPLLSGLSCHRQNTLEWPNYFTDKKICQYLPILVLLLLLILRQPLAAQFGPYSNLRIRTLYVPSPDSLITLDSLSIVPNSVQILQNGLWLAQPPIELHWESGKIKWLSTPTDSIQIKYRVWPSNLAKPRDKTPLLLSSSNTTKNLPIFQEGRKSMLLAQNKNPLDLDGLEYSGSIYRGITVGNNQDAALHSGMNLNMRGQLSNGIEILASITDANIPLQPEGNSASIQEFDRIFIQLKKKQHQLILGDFDIRDIPSNYFLKFDRKLQGINYKSTLQLDSSKKLTLGTTASVTRGHFARNTFTARENQQGPYRLIGNNGETFIIVIAGTERVFINGQEMRRGHDLDYTINYNLGEITFTPKRLITQDLRIIVEFQYADRNFFRYTLEANSSFQNKHTKIYSQFFLESDDRNQPLNQQYSPQQIEILKKIGNDENSAIVPSEKSTAWEATRILYRKKDTFSGGVEYSGILEQATISTDSALTATFTFVGSGKGNYRLKATNANGPVYEWVAPINGIPQGTFEPIVKLPTPKNHLQAIVGIESKPTKGLEIASELAYTSQDLNLYSPIDNEKNNGLGAMLKTSYTHQFDSSKSLKIKWTHEYTSQNFSPVTRYRNLEFNRDWDLNVSSRNVQRQNQTQANIEYRTKTTQLFYQFTGFWVDSIYAGNQHVFGTQLNLRKWELAASSDLISAKPLDSQSTFWRPKVSATYYLDSDKNWRVGGGLSHEIRIKQLENARQWLNSSFDWQNYTLFIASADQKPNRAKLEYIYRTEAYTSSVLPNEFDAPAITSHTFRLLGTLDKNPQNQLKYTLTFRNFRSKFDTLGAELNHNYMGRIEYNRQIMRGFFRSHSSYEIKAGREQKMQISYIRAPNGYGNYAWNDLNGNGIFEIDEAYVSAFPLENRYVRFFTLLPEFVPAHQLQYSQNIWLNPRAAWFGKKDYRKFLSKLNYHLRLDLERKQTTDRQTPFSEYINPFLALSAENILTSKTNFFQQLSYQKNEGSTGIDLEHSSTYLKNLMTNGIEGNINRQFTLRWRQNISTQFSTLLRATNGLRRNESEFFEERNYSFVQNELEGKFISTFSDRLRAWLGGIYWFKSTHFQYSLNRQADLEITYSHPKEGQIEGKISLLELDYVQTTPNAQVQLAMLQGIQTGRNLILNLIATQKISKAFQVNITYNGRYNQNLSKWIHNANMEVRAIF